MNIKPTQKRKDIDMSYNRYSNDPKWIKAKYAGIDKNGTAFNAGDNIFYYPLTKQILAGDAAKEAAADFEARLFDDNNCTW